MCNVLVSLTKRPNPVSGSFRHLNKYITHRTTASSQLTSSEGFPIFFTAPMTARFLFRFGMLRTFKHKTRGHRPRPQSSGALCALWLAKYVIAFARRGNPATIHGADLSPRSRQGVHHGFKNQLAVNA